MDKKVISILGCGWLGVPLAQELINGGYQVKGSVTSPEKLEMLEREGISPFRVVLGPERTEISDPAFFDCDVLIISIPPRRIDGIEAIFPQQINQLIPEIRKHNIPKVVFISSTSVYPENLLTARETDENLPDKPSGKALVIAENLLKNEGSFQTTIVRFGGLIGADRNPARFLLRSKAAVSNTPVNLIHLDDCIGILISVIEQEVWGETLNACSPEHPYKKDFYAQAAQISGLPEPLISDARESYKIVDSSKLIRLLNYRFVYPSPMDYLNSLTRH